MRGFSNFGKWFMGHFDEEHRTVSTLAKALNIPWKQAKRLLTDKEPARSAGDRRSDALLMLLDEMQLHTVHQRREFLLRLLRQTIPANLCMLVDELESLNERARAKAEISDRALRKICDVFNSEDESSAIRALHNWADRMSPSRVRAIASAVEEYRDEMEKVTAPLEK
jgi:hypothetical protein